MPVGTGPQGAAETLNRVDKAACWRLGWRGWGWYPCWYGPRTYDFYGAYRPWGWGYRRWSWGRRRHW